MLRTPAAAVAASSPGRRLQDQLAHDDAHSEEEHDEGHGAHAQAILLLHGDRGVRGRHHVALPHPKAVVLLAGERGERGGATQRAKKMVLKERRS